MTYIRLTDIQYVPSIVAPLFQNTVGSSAIKEIALYNTDSVARNVTIYNVPDSGGGLGIPTTDHIVWTGLIQPNSSPNLEDRPIWNYPIVLSDVGDSIQAVTDVSSTITCMVLGDNDTTTGGIDISDIMVKSVYDTGDDGSADNANQFNGQNPAFYLDAANHTGIQDISTVEGFIKLFASTTDATPTGLTTDGLGIGASNQLQIADDTTVEFRFIISSFNPANQEVTSWRLDGTLTRGTGEASTQLKNYTLDVITEDVLDARDLVPTADTTNGALTLTFTGEAATNITTRARGEYVTIT